MMRIKEMVLRVGGGGRKEKERKVIVFWVDLNFVFLGKKKFLLYGFLCIFNVFV